MRASPDHHQTFKPTTLIPVGRGSRNGLMHGAPSRCVQFINQRAAGAGNSATWPSRTRAPCVAVGSRLGVVSQLGHHTSTTSSIALGILQVVPTLCFSIDHHPGCMSVAGHVASLASPKRPRSIDLSAFGVVRPGDSSSGEKVPSPVAGRRLAGYLAGCKIFLHCVGPTISFSASVGTCMHTCAGLPVVCLENEQFMSSLCVGKLIIVRSAADVVLL
jgi:hypothetical protein